MRLFVIYTSILVALMAFAQPLALRAQEANVLAQCRAQTQDLDEIHNCLDNYLNIMDGNIKAITDFLDDALTGDAQEGLARSQAAFAEYRRQNCLWYLDFSWPRREAEQIAKNCLATMSQQRLTELQALVTGDSTSDKAFRGFYVYGAERNTFQLCGSSDRYWVEGDASIVGLMQQTYLSVATDERQLLHAMFVGTVDKELQAPAEHQGIFKLSNFIELKVPTESDCQIPTRTSLAASLQGETGIVENELQREIADDEEIVQDEPEQQLIAYFGDWQVDCVEITDLKSCELKVDLQEPNSASDNLQSRLIVHRTPSKATFLEALFPDREIDSPSRIRWSIDVTAYGDIVDSEIRVDESGTRQIVSESEFLTTELMPALIEGESVVLNVLESVDDSSGTIFTATLLGLTKALVFADDFVREDG